MSGLSRRVNRNTFKQRRSSFKSIHRYFIDKPNKFNSEKAPLTLNDILQSIRAFLVNIIIIFISAVIIYHTFKEITTEYIVIEPFEVPEDLAKKGYNGRVFVNKIIDQIDYIKTTAKTNQSKLFIGNWAQSEVEIEIPGAGISLATISKVLRRVLSKEPTKITGEIYINENKIFMTTRVSGKPNFTTSTKLETLDSAINNTSQIIIKYTQPIVLFLYQSEIDENCSTCIETLEYTIANEPIDDDNDAYLGWGWVLDKFRNYNEAIVKYQLALEIDSTSETAAVVYSNLGSTLNDLGEHQAAIPKLQKAIKLDPNNAEAYNNWGATLNNLGEHQAALLKYQKAIELNPDFALAYSNWGATLNDLGEHQAAISKLQKAIELNPNEADAFIHWGIALNNLGEHQAALLKYQKAIELNPNNAFAYSNWGATLNDLGKHQAAISKLQKAIELNPDNAFAYSNWGVALNGLGEHQAAIPKYQKAIELNPNDAFAYFNWGYTLDDLGDSKAASIKYQKATELDPNYAIAYNNWGYALNKLNNFKAAIPKFQKAIELNPNEGFAYNNWGHALNKLSDFKAAIPKFQKAIELNPDNDDAYFNWGIALNGLGKHQAGIAKLQQALKLNPNNADAKRLIKEMKENK